MEYHRWEMRRWSRARTAAAQCSLASRPCKSQLYMLGRQRPQGMCCLSCRLGVRLGVGHLLSPPVEAATGLPTLRAGGALRGRFRFAGERTI
jgi:hypothetical protein